MVCSTYYYLYVVDIHHFLGLNIRFRPTGGGVKTCRGLSTLNLLLRNVLVSVCNPIHVKVLFQLGDIFTAPSHKFHQLSTGIIGFSISHTVIDTTQVIYRLEC